MPRLLGRAPGAGELSPRAEGERTQKPGIPGRPGVVVAPLAYLRLRRWRRLLLGPAVLSWLRAAGRTGFSSCILQAPLEHGLSNCDAWA